MIVNVVKDIDFKYIGFGFGLLTFATDIFTEGHSIFWGLVTLLSAVIFMGYGIGELLGRGGRLILEQNAIIGIIIGELVLTPL